MTGPDLPPALLEALPAIAGRPDPTPEITLGDLGLDSLETLSLALDLEGRLGIDLGDPSWMGWPLDTTLRSIALQIQRAQGDAGKTEKTHG